MATILDKNKFIEQLASKRYQSLDANQRLFVDDWISTHYVKLISRFRNFAAAALVIGGLGTFNALPLVPSITIALGNLATMSCLYLWHFSSLQSDTKGRWYWYGMVGSTSFSHALAIAWVFRSSEFNSVHFWVTTGFICTFLYLLVVCPYFGKTTVISGLIGIAAGYLAYSSTGIFNNIIILCALCIVGGTGWILNKMAFSFAVSEGYAQLVRRDLLRQNEALKRESLEKDLFLAREVQDSFLPPDNGVNLGFNYMAKFYKSNSQTLGGDWMAYRVLDDQTFVAMILDATGKGTSAALVVHAVQSLWVKSLSYPKFDVEEWIRSVNRTLSQFGNKSVHSVTMGIVAFRPQRMLTYYSCGHVPIFATSDQNREDPVVMSLTGGGDILGLKDDCLIGVTTITQQVSSIKSIFLGTDGIFPKGTRTGKRSIFKLEDHLERNDPAYLSTIEAKDDKLLLWIHKEVS